MRAAYRYLSLAVPVLVALQAAFIAFAIFGLGHWVDEGNSFTKSVMDSQNVHFTGDVGFALHAIIGTTLIPLVALLVLITSFFTKVPGTWKWGLAIFVDVVLQIVIGGLGDKLPPVGGLHGLNAIILAGLGAMAARHVRVGEPTGPRETVAA